RVVAKLDAYPDWELPAKVIAIIPTADRQKATVKVRIGFDQLNQRILPDMGVRVAFRGDEPAGSSAGGLRIPRAAIRQADGRDVVWVMRDGRVERRAIQYTGSSSETNAIVQAGLSAGERVVVEGPPTLSEADRVREKKP